MKNIKRGLSIAIVAAMVLGMTACGGSGKTESAGKAAEKNHFIETQPLPAEGSPADINAKEFADNVKAADDSLEVVVYPAAQLGDYTAVQELVSVGDVEMQMATLSSTVDKYLESQVLPIYALPGMKQRQFSAVTVNYGNHPDTSGRQNIKLLSVYPLYFGGAILNKEPNQPANLDVREGYKVRCQDQ